jgi:sigma-B regulation protein RsbU (phosphoserine phosphatase)
MHPAPIPSDDASRLAELHALGLLDTPPEERFDRITRLLSLVMRVPIAYIALVDADRQWFKSSCGLPTQQTPRAISFCGHTIIGDGPMIVPDATKDERFFDNPIVTGEPYIRFYAGYPLSGPGGSKVGTLCIADRQPRTLLEPEVQALAEMAQIVERELGLIETVRLQHALIESQRQLMSELEQAAGYVRSVLPEPIDGPVRTRWRFEPSSRLGGDSLGYDWIDPDHFAFFLLDVSGHGVGSALLSVSVANALRSRSLPDTDFRDPASVLARLNEVYPMERHDEKYFTLWYGVYDRNERRLSYASAGHPAALLRTGPTDEMARPLPLDVHNLPVGMIPGLRFVGSDVELEPYGQLYVFSDGAYEIVRPDGSMMRWDDLVAFLASAPAVEDVLQFVRQAGETESLIDDFSILEVEFRGAHG